MWAMVRRLSLKLYKSFASGDRERANWKGCPDFGLRFLCVLWGNRFLNRQHRKEIRKVNKDVWE